MLHILQGQSRRVRYGTRHVVCIVGGADEIKQFTEWILKREFLLTEGFRPPGVDTGTKIRI